jgi:hypothetical protein
VLKAEPDTVVINELGILQGQSRVDIAVVNGALHGFELKSERDSLRRLEAQVKAYGQVMDRATLVATERHLDRAATLVPAWWELIAVRERRGQLCLASVRRGRLNQSTSLRAIVELLWYDEALELLRVHGHSRGVVRKPRRLVWDRICEVLEPDDVRRAVRDRLKARAMLRSAPERS